MLRPSLNPSIFDLWRDLRAATQEIRRGVPNARDLDRAGAGQAARPAEQVNAVLGQPSFLAGANVARAHEIPPGQHGSFEVVAPPHDWWDWYAAYLHARETGSTSDEAAAIAGRYLAETRQVVVSVAGPHRQPIWSTVGPTIHPAGTVLRARREGPLVSDRSAGATAPRGGQLSPSPPAESPTPESTPPES